MMGLKRSIWQGRHGRHGAAEEDLNPEVQLHESAVIPLSVLAAGPVNMYRGPLFPNPMGGRDDNDAGNGTYPKLS